MQAAAGSASGEGPGGASASSESEAAADDVGPSVSGPGVLVAAPLPAPPHPVGEEAQVAEWGHATILARRAGGAEATGDARRAPREDPLDPALRQWAQPALHALGSNAVPAAASPAVSAEVRARGSLEDVLSAIVRRVAWSGDGRKGSLRLEFGAGVLAGGTLVVHADDGRVRVELQVPSGADCSAWKERIASRLEERRVHVEEVVVE